MKSINKIKNGSLYLNKKSSRVERVIGRINSQRVWTTFHDKTPVAVRIVNLEVASDEEVEAYLQDSPNMVNV